MENPAIDRCLVVGAEEADWLLCDAYQPLAISCARSRRHELFAARALAA